MGEDVNVEMTKRHAPPCPVGHELLIQRVLPDLQQSMPVSSPINVNFSHCTMLFARIAARSTSGLRSFSTTRVSCIQLSYEVYRPETEQREPILFLHGLFGSKQNNRGISKYASRSLKARQKLRSLLLQSSG